jgi:hypothetical protein
MAKLMALSAAPSPDPNAAEMAGRLKDITA